MRASRSVIAALCLFVNAQVSQAEPLVLDGGWQTFEVPQGAAPIPWDRTFEFVLVAPALLRVQDAFINLEQFEVFDNGVSIGMTSFPEDRGGVAQDSPDVAATMDEFSRGSFLLAAGAHTISGENVFNIEPDQSAAVAFIRLDSVSVTEPHGATLLLAALAMGLMVGTRRRH